MIERRAIRDTEATVEPHARRRRGGRGAVRHCYNNENPCDVVSTAHRGAAADGSTAAPAIGSRSGTEQPRAQLTVAETLEHVPPRSTAANRVRSGVVAGLKAGDDRPWRSRTGCTTRSR